MKIGIDIDDTMTNTLGMMKKYLKQYSNEPISLNWNDWSDKTKHEFLFEYMETIAKNVELKENVLENLEYLKNKGHELFVVTSRSNYFAPNITTLTEQYIIKNNLPFDHIITSAGNKLDVCIKNDIDLLIDDNKVICELLTKNGIKVILFDSELNKNCKIKRICHWNEIKKVL